MEKRRRTDSNNFDVPKPRLVRLGAGQDTKSNKKEAADTGGYSFTFPQPYQPEFATPEKVQWPVDRHQMNRYARLFYKTDSTISTVLDLQADIIATDFELTGGGMDSNEVRAIYEDMVRETQIVSLFRYFITEFLIMGEVVPHCVLDKDKKRWTHIVCHNPDQVNVIDSPFLAIDPVVEFVPDASLKKLIKSKHPTVQRIISTLPGDMLSAINKGRGIPLDTTLNTTFIPRKLHPYDIRGTSILTKLIRVLMYEDAIVNACFQEGTPVLMSNYIYKPIQEVKVDDKVIDKEGQVQTVEASWSEEPKGELVRIILQEGQILVSTYNHKYPVLHNGKIIKIEADQIMEGDCLTSPICLNLYKDMWKDANYIYVPVKKVEKVKSNKKVYNLTISGTHSYLVDGIGTYNSISTARRHSGPLKIAYLGEKDVGGKGPWIPDAEYQDELIRLLTVAEQDPHAFLVLPWFVRFEAFGTTDRMMSIRNEWDVIERMKLTALGVSQGFLHGECQIFDTPVLTSDYIYKPIQEIKVGRKVIDRKGNIQVVTNAWKSKTPETLTEIKLIGGTTLVSTDNHKYPVFRNGKIIKIEAKEIIEGDYLTSPRCLNIYKDVEVKDSEFFYVPVKSVKVIENLDKIPVYNLTVDGDHSYVVGGGIGTYNSTYASMTGTLQTMLMRFRALRTFFENVWWYPKFFQPIAEMNEFIKRPQSEVKHKLRFRKSRREIIEGNLLLMPKIQWNRSLDPNIDTNLLDVYDKLVNRLELPLSKTTAYSAAGLNFEEQVRQSLNEKKKEQEIATEYGVSPEESIMSEEKDTDNNVPSESAEGSEALPSAEEIEKMEEIPVEDKTEEGIEPTKIIHRRRRANKFPFTQEELDSLVEFMETGKTASELWSLVKLRKKGNDSTTVEWEDIEDFLNSEGYKQTDINQLQYNLIHRTKVYSEIDKDVSKLHEDMSDEEFKKATDKIIDKHSEMFFAGAANSRYVK